MALKKEVLPSNIDHEWYEVRHLPEEYQKSDFYENKESIKENRKKSKLHILLDGLRSFTAWVFSNVGICVLVIAYLLLGAATFKEIEGYHEDMQQSYIVTKKRLEMASSLWKTTEKYNTLHRTNWTIQVQSSIDAYQKYILEEIDNGYDGNDHPKKLWTFSGALLYSITVITTIGYGHIAPSTLAGKVLTIIYAVIGMPLFLLYLSNIGNILATAFKWTYQRCFQCRKKKKRNSNVVIAEYPTHEVQRPNLENFYEYNGEIENFYTKDIVDSPMMSDQVEIYNPHHHYGDNLTQLAENFCDNNYDYNQGQKFLQYQYSASNVFIQEPMDDEDVGPVTVPISLCLLVMISYICGGAILFGEWEGWSFLDGTYFCFITLSTIGFGDFVPGDSLGDSLGDSDNIEMTLENLVNAQFIFCTCYILLGMAVIAMCFNLMQEKVVEAFLSFGRKLGVI